MKMEAPTFPGQIWSMEAPNQCLPSRELKRTHARVLRSIRILKKAACAHPSEVCSQKRDGSPRASPRASPASHRPDQRVRPKTFFATRRSWCRASGRRVGRAPCRSSETQKRAAWRTPKKGEPKGTEDVRHGGNSERGSKSPRGNRPIHSLCWGPRNMQLKFSSWDRMTKVERAKRAQKSS